jgi:Na+/proline symporter
MTSPAVLTVVTLIGVGIAAIVCLVIGIRVRTNAKSAADLLPMRRGHQAAINSAQEFSAATVATTISLATVVLAYFELAAYMGTWLLWTALTTACGIFMVYLVSSRIRDRLGSYGARIPTLHEFLATEFGAPSLAVVGALATSLGFLGAFGVELSVGSRLFAALVPGAPTWIVVAVLAAIGVSYTALGGFRAVILTDRLQMAAIWVFIAALSLYYGVVIATGEGSRGRLDPAVYDFSGRDGLIPFLVGIFILNVPTFVADMGMWQRVTSLRERQESARALSRSAVGAAVSWGLLAGLAILVPLVVNSVEGTNPLLSLLQSLATSGWGSIVLGVTVLGLFAAMLSTASTQLIVVSHTIHEDLIGRKALTAPKLDLRGEIWRVRLLLVITAVLAIGVVELLTAAGFSIADLVFAVFGAQLSLCPPVFAALLLPRPRLHELRNHAMIGVVAGFVLGWVAAFAGKATGNGNLVFLSPAVSLVVSLVVLATGLLRRAAPRVSLPEVVS